MILVVAFCLLLEGASAADYGQGLLNIHHHLARAKRQTIENTHCKVLVASAYCSTSYIQNNINYFSKCGAEVNDINRLEMLCRKNQQGLFCVEALEYVDGNCTESTCTAGCSNSLRLAGCCVNDVTTSRSTYLTTCNIQLLPPCKHSNLRIPNIAQDHSCSDIGYLSASCDNIGPVITAITREEACNENAEMFRDLCSSKNGQYCQKDFSNFSSIGYQAIMKSVNDCPSVSNCSLQCSTSLNFLKNTVGCCFHYSNASGSSYPQSSIYSTQLWNSCGISVPQRCGSFSAVYNRRFVHFFWILAGFTVVFFQRV